MTGGRMNWIDALKFIGMFYIYIGHLGAAAGKIHLFVFSFHVPLFFFISGLVWQAVRDNASLRAGLARAFKAIVVPYFVFSLIGVAFLTLQGDLPLSSVQHLLWQVLLGIRNEIPLESLWFLPCLFVVIVYYALLERLLRNRLAVFAVAFLIYVNARLWWEGTPSVVFNADSALYFLSYFACGAWVSAARVDRLIASPRRDARLLKVALVLASLGVMAFVYYRSLYEPFNGLRSVQLQYVGYFAMTLLMFIPSIALATLVKLPAILLLGRNSLLLCGTEQICKLSLLSLMSVLGLTQAIKNPLDAVIFTGLCFAFSYATFLQVYLSLRRPAPPARG